jgi:hypothetical protein
MAIAPTMISATVTSPIAIQMLVCTEAHVVLAFADHVLSGVCELISAFTTIMPTKSMIMRPIIPLFSQTKHKRK